MFIYLINNYLLVITYYQLELGTEKAITRKTEICLL